MATHVLFVCPKASGTGLLAATYFQAAAVRAALDIHVEVAGTEPDIRNDARVEQALERQGYSIGWSPRLVTAFDLSAADLIVSLGCDHEALPTDKTIIEWPVAKLDEAFDSCVNAIHDRAEALAAEVAAARDVLGD